MNFLTDWADSIGEWGGAQIAKIGLTLDMAKSPEVRRAMPGALPEPISDFMIGTGDVMSAGIDKAGWALNLPGQYARRAIATPFAAARVARREAVEAGAEPGSLEEWKEFFSGESWGEAWEYAKDTSVMQNVFDAKSVSTLTPETDRPGTYANEFAPTDVELEQRQRTNAFENVAGGLTDLGINFFLDPLNKAGRIVELSQIARRTLPAGEDVAEAIRTAGGTKPTFLKVPVGKSVGQRWQNVKEVVKTQDTAGIYAYVDGLADSPNGMAMASALNKASKVEDPVEADRQIDLVGRLLHGDETARRELSERNAEIADQIAAVQMEVGQIEKAAIHTGIDDQTILFVDDDATPPSLYWDRPEVEALYNERLKTLQGLEDEQERVLGILQPDISGRELFASATENVLDVTSGSVRRGKRMLGYGGFRQMVRDLDEVKPGWVESGGMIRRSLWNVPIKLLKVPAKVGDAMTTMRGQGLVNLHAPDAVKEFDTLFSSPLLRDFDGNERRKFISQFVDADGEAGKTLVINQAETAVFAHIAAKHGVSPKAASALVNTFKQARMSWTNRLKMYAGMEGGQAYSSAPNPADPKFKADTFIDEDGNAIRAPLLPEHLRNRVPLLDVGMVDHVMRRNANKVQAWADWMEDTEKSFGFLPKALRRADAVRWGMQEAAMDGLNMFNRLWKFGVLFRLGYPLRNLTDEQARSWARVDSAMAELYLEGAWNVVRNLGWKRRQVNAAMAAHRLDLEKQKALEIEVANWDPDGTVGKKANSALRKVEAKVNKALSRSKARDADGNLLRVYRGTGNSFYTADPSKVRQFGPDAPQVEPAYLDVRKPFQWETDTISKVSARKLTREIFDGEEFADEYAKIIDGPITADDLKARLELGFADMEMQAKFDGLIADHLRKQGYDAVRKGDDWRVFDTRQAKSAFEMEGDIAEMGELRETLSGATEIFISKHKELQSLNAKLEEADKNPAQIYNIGTKDVEVTGGVIPSPFETTSSRDPSDLRRRQSSGQGMHETLIAGGEKLAYQRMNTAGDWVDIQGHEPGHAEAWLHGVNNVVKISGPMKLMLEGRSDKYIVNWLRTDREGKAISKRMAHHSTNKAEWVTRMRAHFDHYVPEDSGWREILKNRKLNGEDIAEYKKTHDVLPAVNGPELQYDAGMGPMANVINRAMRSATQWLGDIPADRLARHPLYVAVYRRSAKQEADRLLNAGNRLKSTEVLDAEDIAHIQQKSHSMALREVKRTLFDASAHSNAAQTMRFLSPFMGAWEDTMKRWWSITKEKPQVLNYFSQAWQMPNKVVEVVDGEGNPVSESRELSDDEFIVAKFPPWLGGKEIKGLPGQMLAYLPKSSFNIWLQSDPWFMPGVGPLVQMPVGYFQTKNPQWDSVAKFINPFGPADNVLDAIAPATVRRISAYLEGPGNREFGRDAVTIHSAALYDWEKSGREGPMPKWEDSIKATQGLTLVKIFNNFLSPFPAQFRSPYQYIIDEHRRLQDEGRMQDMAPDYADRKLVEKYGRESLILIQSLSQNALSAQPTNEWVEAYKGDPELVKGYPSFVRHLIGNRGDGEFSKSAYAFQMQEALRVGGSDTIRSLKDPVKAMEENEAAMGWWDYKQLSNWLQSQAAAEGLEDYRDSDGLRFMKRFYTEKLRQSNPAWDRAYSEATKPDKFDVKYRELQRLVADKNFDSKTHPMQTDWPLIQEYVKMRDYFTNTLKTRPQTTMEAKANADLRFTYGRMMAQLRQNTQFSDNWYDGFLENDPYLPDLVEEDVTK